MRSPGTIYSICRRRTFCFRFFIAASAVSTLQSSLIVFCSIYHKWVGPLQLRLGTRRMFGKYMNRFEHADGTCLTTMSSGNASQRMGMVQRPHNYRLREALAPTRGRDASGVRAPSRPDASEVFRFYVLCPRCEYPLAPRQPIRRAVVGLTWRDFESSLSKMISLSPRT
jgi:hypothetical protein